MNLQVRKICSINTDNLNSNNNNKDQASKLILGPRHLLSNKAIEHLKIITKGMGLSNQYREKPTMQIVQDNLNMVDHKEVDKICKIKKLPSRN